jgi:hypothetical protein
MERQGTSATDDLRWDSGLDGLLSRLYGLGFRARFGIGRSALWVVRSGV